MSNTNIHHIVIHTAASYDYNKKQVVYQPVSVVADYHVLHNGWKSLGYHYYIEGDGIVQVGRPESEVGAHVGGFNAGTIGICCAGHGDFADFNDMQKYSLYILLEKLLRKYVSLTPDDVIGHRETPKFGAAYTYKTCPGIKVDMDSIRIELKRAIRPAAEMQKPPSLEDRVAKLETFCKSLGAKL